MKRTTVGLISDTHGVIVPAVWKLFAGVDAILHAGDWGNYALVSDLKAVAPVHGVRGNMDEPTRRIPELLATRIHGVEVYVVHRLDTSRRMLSFLVDHKAKMGSPIDVALFGHTHRVFIEEVDRVVFVNPGSASRPRGEGSRSAGLLHIVDGAVDSVTIHDLDVEDLPLIAEWRRDGTQ